MVMKDNFWSTTFWTITIALLIGAGAGILATSYTSSYLEEYAIELSRLTAPLRLTQTEPKSFPSSLEDAIRRFNTDNLSSIVSIYPPNLTRPFGFKRDDLLASGLVLTSDGWILAPKQTKAFYSKSVVVIGDKTYPVETIVEDTGSDVVFIKIQADSLNIVGFGSGLNISIADQVLVTSASGVIQVRTVLSKSTTQSLLISSDRLYQTVVLENMINEPSFVFSLGGDLIGFVSDTKETEPVVILSESFLPQFRSLLETGVVHQPSLGLETVSLNSSVGMSNEVKRSRKYGAYVPDQRSIFKKGPAETAGIKPLDIILSYNGQALNGDHTLDQFVVQSKVGDQILLTIDREGEELDVKVILGEL